MTSAKTKTELSDGQKLCIRPPAVPKDLDHLVAFFKGLPAEIRNYLRYDVTQAKYCLARLQQVDGKDHWRLLAELDGEIVGDATLDREPFGWTRHVAELRGVVSPKAEKLGVGIALFNALVELGAEGGIERLFTEVMPEQKEMIENLKQAGFNTEATRKNYAKDLNGKLHDLIIMSNDLESVWKRLADQLEDMDVQIARLG